MEWLAIPGIILGIMLGLIALGYILDRILDKDKYDCEKSRFSGMFFCASLLLISIIVSSITYYGTRVQALEAEAYYQYVVLPHVVEEYEDYVVVENVEAGIWQAGEMNLPGYNAYLKSKRWWDSIPIIGTSIYGPPDYLKYVEVQ